MATFWERAANSVNRILSFIVYIYDFLFSFWYRGEDSSSDCIRSLSLLTFNFF